MPDMGDVFRRDAALEVSVAYLVIASHVPKTDGKITLAVVLEVYLITFSFRQFQVYSPALQISDTVGLDDRRKCDFIVFVCEAGLLPRLYRKI